MTRIAQSNATAAEEITSTMIDLSRLAEQSRGHVERFARAKENAPADDGPASETLHQEQPMLRLVAIRRFGATPDKKIVDRSSGEP